MGIFILCIQHTALDSEAAAQAQHQVQGSLLLHVIVRQGAPVLQLLASKNEALLIRRDALLILNLLLDVLNRIAGLGVQRDGLARQSLDKDLHLLLARRPTAGSWTHKYRPPEPP